MDPDLTDFGFNRQNSSILRRYPLVDTSVPARKSDCLVVVLVSRVASVTRI
jgi:hypothetical protein